jgi:hypothetical protein
MCRKFLLLSVWGLSIVASLPIAAWAADPSDDDADTATGPILVAPQNERPAAAREPASSSRRQWLDRAHSIGMDKADHTDDLNSASRVAYDTTLINDYWLTHGAQPDDQPASTSRAARAAAWCGQRLKRALIEVHGAAITYSCEQPDASAGPKLLPPQQAKPIAALAEADVEVESLQLDPDEPAKVILDIREQVGPKLFAGTIFEDAGWRARASAETPRADQRAQLVRCIRDMAQNRETCDDHCEFVCDPSTGASGYRMVSSTSQCDDQCEFDTCPTSYPTTCTATCATLTSAGDAEPATPPSAVPALRQTSRQLDKLAEALEEQKLYDRADELRGLAQQLREQARGSDSPAPIERSARK